MHVIELNDAGLRIAGTEGVLLESPAYALLDQDRLLLGEPALRESRLSPRFINHQFWDRLSLDPLSRPAPRARTQADLAYAHLLQLWDTTALDDNEVIFAVPGRFTREQLSLLLGIARESPFSAVGLVDLAVAAVAATGETAREVALVDAQLHRTVMTRLVVDAEIEREHVDDVAATAITSLRDAWVGLIADAFIRETRLDPFHDARTEQQLYDRLDRWLTMLNDDGEGQLEIEHQNNTFRVVLDRRQIVDRARPRYLQLADRLQALVSGDDARVLLSHRAAALPGLREALEETLHVPVDLVASDAALRGALAHASLIRRDDERLAFVTRLPNVRARGSARTAAPTRPSPASAPPPAARAAGIEPTHVLLGARAWPLADGVLTLGGPNNAVQAQHDALPSALACRVHRSGGKWLLELAGGTADVTSGDQPLTFPVELTPGQAVLLDGRVRLELIEIASLARPAPLEHPA